MSDDAPKSAYELAMERLRQKDKEASVEERPLTEKQKAAIAEARQFHQAKSAYISSTAVASAGALAGSVGAIAAKSPNPG